MLQIDQIRLDFRAKNPLYLQLVDQMRQQIERGMVEADDQLPPVRSLASSLRVNFNTVARAYRVLDIEGWISTQQGRGTYVTPQSWPYSAVLEADTSPPPETLPEAPGAVTMLEEPTEAQPETTRDAQIASWMARAEQNGIAAADIASYLLAAHPQLRIWRAVSSGRLAKAPYTSRHRSRKIRYAARKYRRSAAHTSRRDIARLRSVEIPQQVSDEQIVEHIATGITQGRVIRRRNPRRSTGKQRLRGVVNR